MTRQQARKLLGEVVVFRKSPHWYFPIKMKTENYSEWIGLVIYDKTSQNFKIQVEKCVAFHEEIIDGRTIKILPKEEAIIWKLTMEIGD